VQPARPSGAGALGFMGPDPNSRQVVLRLRTVERTIPRMENGKLKVTVERTIPRMENGKLKVTLWRLFRRVIVQQQVIRALIERPDNGFAYASVRLQPLETFVMSSSGTWISASSASTSS
jgi:hypothetical protein